MHCILYYIALCTLKTQNSDMQEHFLTISLFLGLGGAEGRIAECMEIIEKAAHGRVLAVAAAGCGAVVTPASSGCWLSVSGRGENRPRPAQPQPSLSPQPRLDGHWGGAGAGQLGS